MPTCTALRNATAHMCFISDFSHQEISSSFVNVSVLLRRRLASFIFVYQQYRVAWHFALSSLVAKTLCARQGSPSGHHRQSLWSVRLRPEPVWTFQVSVV